MPKARQPTGPQKPIVHVSVWQSVASLHALKSGQRGQVVAPPQSTSVSPWFRTPSVQVGGGAQCPRCRPRCCSRCPSGTCRPPGSPRSPAPPQSTSVSVPFWIMSVQVAATQTLLAQTRLAQSVVAPQRRPLAQAVHTVPPQSTSVSAPFELRVGARDAHAAPCNAR